MSLLLPAFRIGLLTMLPSILRMLLGVFREFFALCVVAFAMMLCRSAMGLGGILVMFRRLVVFVSSHCFLRLMFT